MRLRTCVLALAVLAATGCPDSSSPSGRVAPAATAKAPAPTLSGQVTGEDGEPVAQAFLVLSSQSDGLVPEGVDPERLFTEENGGFAVRLPADRYQLTVVAIDGARAQTTVDLTRGDVRIELALAVDVQAQVDLIETGRGAADLGEETSR